MPEFQLSSKPRLKCRCGKVRAMDLADAKRMVKYVTVKSGHDNPVRYYQCGFGGWHWTRMLVVNGKPEGPTPGRECASPTCQNRFAPRNENQVYCSGTCANREAKKRRKTRKLETRICTLCGHSFETADAGQKRHTNLQCPKECADCGKPFVPTEVAQKFCGRQCRDHDQMKKYAARHPVTPRSIAKMLGES